MSTAPPITLASPDARSRVVDTIVRAFAADPAFGWFFADRYDELAPLFAGYLFDVRVGRHGVWMIGDAQAVALWNPPDGSERGPDPHPDRDGLQARLRDQLEPEAWERLEAYERPVAEAITDDPHWYLGILATHPDHRGRRLGRAVAEPGLEQAHRDGVPAVLETTNPDNVRVYESAGWEVTATLDPVPGLTVWVMMQEPPSP